MKIVCGTDFTANSKAAADVAAALAGRLGQTLNLVHVVDEFGVYSSTGGIPEEMSVEAKAALDAEVARLRSSGVEVRADLLHGAPDQKINEQVGEEGRSNMVVVSSLGHRAPERWLLGSVSSRLVESATVPTLVLRDGASMIEWLTGQRTLKILVCFDGSVTSEAALRWATGLTSAGKCEIVAAFVASPIAEQMRLGINAPISFSQNAAAVQEILERDFAEHVSRIAGDLPVRIRIESGFGRVDAALAQIAHEENADLVVVGTHRRRGLDRLWRGSVSKGILLRAPSSVAVVPVTAEECAAIPEVRKVLVATDLGPTARCTVAQACAIASAGSMLHLVTVVPPWSLPGPIAHYEPDRETRKMHDQEVASQRVALRELVPLTATARGLQVTVEVIEHEQPSTAIVQSGERINADIICVGASSGGLIGNLLGSVAQAVVKSSRRPVFVSKTPPR